MSVALKAKRKISMSTSKEFRHGFAVSLTAQPYQNQAAHEQAVSSTKKALPGLDFSYRGALRTELLKILHAKIPSNSLLKYLCFHKRQGGKSRHQSRSFPPPSTAQHLPYLVSNGFTVFETETKTSICLFLLLKSLFLSSGL